MLAIGVHPLCPIGITILSSDLLFESLKDENAIGILNILFGIYACWFANPQMFHPFEGWSLCLRGSQDAML
jgi:hypothetical protein